MFQQINYIELWRIVHLLLQESDITCCFVYEINVKYPKCLELTPLFHSTILPNIRLKSLYLFKQGYTLVFNLAYLGRLADLFRTRQIEIEVSLQNIQPFIAVTPLQIQ